VGRFGGGGKKTGKGKQAKTEEKNPKFLPRKEGRMGMEYVGKTPVGTPFQNHWRFFGFQEGGVFEKLSFVPGEGGGKK